MRHGYVRENTWKVMKDFSLWTSDGKDDSLWWLWRFPQCLDGDWTLSCGSKLLQFRRSESRRVYVSLCWFLCFVQSENVHLFDENVYVMLLVSNWLSAQNTWFSSWTIVPRGSSVWHSVWRWFMYIYLPFGYFIARFCRCNKDHSAGNNQVSAWNICTWIIVRPSAKQRIHEGQ